MREKRPLLYKTWINIKSRCYNNKVPYYKNYGGRGIYLSEEWHIFSNFQRDMLPGFEENLSIDRVDNNLGYSKENCKWSTRSEQAFNRRSKPSVYKTCSNLFSFMGISDTLSNWARYFNFNRSTLYMRIYKYGWSIEKTLTTKNKYYA